jgi:large subunit ribosomal protein L15
VGFSNPNKKEVEWINVSQLNRYEDDEVVDPDRLKNEGVVGNLKDGLKVLGNGDLEKKLTVRAHQFSSGAKKKIEDAGGEWEIVGDKE